MPVPISTRAKKYLSQSAFYTDLEGSTFPDCFRRTRLSDIETPIGLYENTPGQREGSILVTTDGIHFIVNAGTVSFRYSDIANIADASHDLRFLLQHPGERKLIISLMSGEPVELPVTGSRVRSADMASFHSFLRGACQKVAIEAGKMERLDTKRV